MMTFRYLETFGLENCPPCAQALRELSIGLRGLIAHHCESPFSGLALLKEVVGWLRTFHVKRPREGNASGACTPAA